MNTKEEKYKVVDWRFWRWRAAAQYWHQVYQEALDGYVKGIEETQRDCSKREEELGATIRVLRGVVKMRGDLALGTVGAEFAKEAEIRAAFEGVHEGTKWWVMLNRVLERRTREEMGLAVLAGIEAEERHYRAGAVAVLMELVVGMHRLKERAQGAAGAESSKFQGASARPTSSK